MAHADDATLSDPTRGTAPLAELKLELKVRVRELLYLDKPFSAILLVRDDLQISLADAKALVEAFIATERRR